ncbi:MAG: OmpA family protein [Aureispira sp.]|nr:OmpA family protein [Aureispira sp.]
MLQKKIIHTLFFIFIIVSLAQAQRPKVKRANKLMENLNYQGAIELYREVLDRTDDPDAKLNIAECYRKINNTHEMEYWYGQVVLRPDADPLFNYYYAQALHANGKYDKAKAAVNKYIAVNPGDISAQLLLKACNEDVVRNLRASGKLYKVENREELNSKDDDFGPAYYKDGIVFVTAREESAFKKEYNNWSGKKGTNFTELFFATATEIVEGTYQYNYGKNEKFSKKLSTRFHDGPVTFNGDGNEIYFTRNNMEEKADDKIVRLKVYRASGDRKSWSAPKSLPFNSEEYSVVHPSLSKDGTMLFFSSDMPGGFGGMDLYVSYLEEGRWSPPVNLGPSVNTEQNELFPFIHEDGTLYFSSNGHTGLGGLDMYFAKENYGAWTEPVNLGFPVNTSADDFGLILNTDKTHGYFASNREGGQGGDDLYSFIKLSVEVEILVFDSLTQMPLEAAEVFTPCLDVESFSTNMDGKIVTELPLDKACDFAAEKVAYKANSVRVSTKNRKPGEKIFVQIPLSLECVFTISGTIVDQYSNEPIAGALVRLKTACDGEEDEQPVLTDSLGRYEFTEVREDCDLQVKVTKDGYTAAVTTFKTGSNCGRTPDGTETPPIVQDLAINCIGEGCPSDTTTTGGTGGDPERYEVSREELPNGDTKITYSDGTAEIIKSNGDIVHLDNEGNEIDRPDVGPRDIVHIFYDFDDARIRTDAKSGLEMLLFFLERYPGAKVKITSHTDARGTKAYNKRLSKRRAESVVRYLIKQGISKKRLKAKGEGETVMINDCYDGIECSEEQHQENRRTEFFVYDYDGGKEVKSNKPDKIKVDHCNDCPKAPKVESEEGEFTPSSDEFEPVEEETSTDDEATEEDTDTDEFDKK